MGEIIKTDLMKKAINIFGKDRYEQKVLFHDDDCVNYVVLQNAKSLKFINIYGIYYYTNQESITHSKRPFQICHDILYFFDFLNDVSTEEEKENIAIRLNDENKSFAKHVIEKLIKCKIIKGEIKEKIKEKCIL